MLSSIKVGVSKLMSQVAMRSGSQPEHKSHEPRHSPCRQISTGGLRCPGPSRRHLALFSLVALCLSGA